MTDIRNWLKLFEGSTPSLSSPRSNLLLELDWHDKSPMEQVLRRWKGKYVHFTNGAPNRKPSEQQVIQPPETKPAYYDKAGTRAYNRSIVRADRMNAAGNVPKLGVNVRSIWRDPKGVYFYPVNHLLGHSERISTGQQYGFNMRYYYVVDLNLNAPNGVILQRVTWEQIAAIAARNGWSEQMEQFRALSPEEQKKLFPYYSDPSRPGNFLWHFVERLERDNQITWNKAFKGISFIRDENGSIIHSNEPDQVIVFDPSIIKVLEVGETKALPREAKSGDQWRHALTNIIKAVRGEFGGELTWKDKSPILTFEKGMGKFTLAISESYGDVMLGLTAVYGRAEDTATYLKTRDFETLTSEQIVEVIAKKVRKIGALKTDLLFTPVLRIKEVEAMIGTTMTDVPLEYGVRIYNEPPKGTIYVNGDTTLHPDGVDLGVSVAVSLSEKDISITLTSKVCGRAFGWNGNTGADRWVASDREAMLDHMAASIAESLERSFNDLHPEREKQRSWEKFGDLREWSAFRGWFIRSCGLTLEGRLEQHFADAIADYEAYPDKKSLLSEIRYRLHTVFKRY